MLVVYWILLFALTSKLSLGGVGEFLGGLGANMCGAYSEEADPAYDQVQIRAVLHREDTVLEALGSRTWAATMVDGR